MIIFSIAQLLVPSVVVESSNDFSSNITRGSSLSTSSNNITSYWLSPSGNIAFGFYKLPCSNNYSSSNCTQDRYVVGIWFVNSPTKTLVWTANRNDPPLYAPSSILFTDEGNLILQMANNKDKPLLHDEPAEPGLYAVMHDNGNFVLYGSNSRVIWESFDYPTDTILGGQKLKNGDGLISSMTSFNLGYGFFKLSVRQADGLVDIHNMYGTQTVSPADVVSYGRKEYRRSSPITLNLDITGKLCLVGSDDVVVRTLYEDKNIYDQKQRGGHNGLEVTDGSTNATVYMYRATLDTYGRFSLCKERIDGGNISDNGNSIILAVWSPYSRSETEDRIAFFVFCFTEGFIAVGFVCFLIALILIELSGRPRTPVEEENKEGTYHRI